MHIFVRRKILTKLFLRPPPAPPRPRPAPSKKSRPEPESPEKEVFNLLFLFSFLFFFSRVGTISFVETNITSHQYEPELWRPEIKTRRVNTREVMAPFFLGSSFDFDSRFFILVRCYSPFFLGSSLDLDSRSFSRSLKIKKHNQKCH